MAVNNEIGTINPISELGAICKQADVPFMVDGAQGCGKVPVSLRPVQTEPRANSGIRRECSKIKSLGAVVYFSGIPNFCDTSSKTQLYQYPFEVLFLAYQNPFPALGGINPVSSPIALL